MSRRIHQIKNVILTVTGPIVEAYRLSFDGDATFALDIHIVEHLFFHLTLVSPPQNWIRRSAVDLP